MANLNFPSTTGQPTDGSFQYTDANNGVIYSWDGTKWQANSGSSLNTMYVQVAGDNMTGDLTLGIDNITLNATDGSGVFKVDTGAGVSITKTGKVPTNGNPDDGFRINADGLFGYNSTGSNCFLTVNTGGTGNLNLGSSIGVSGGVTNITLNANGSATFAGLVDANVVNAKAYTALCPNNSISMFAGSYVGANSNTVDIKADGSAVFAGGITVNAAQYGPIRVNSTSQYGQGFTTNGSGSTIGSDTAYTAALNGSATWSVLYNGNATFRNAILNLEADDDTKYTSTTDADGNETRVYNGATLDVKDRLTKTDAALQSLKAALATTTDHESLKAALIAALADI